MRLTDKPGQEIKNLGKKMAEMVCWINGTVSAPINLYTLITTDFIDWKVLAFQMKNTGFRDLVYSNPKALSADDIIRTLKTKFRYLKLQGQ